MNANTRISEIMTRQVDTVSPTDRMEEISARFDGGGHYHFPVIDDDSGEIVGIVSRTDYLRLQHSLTKFKTPEAEQSNARLLHSMLVEDVMTAPVETIAPDATLKEAADHFRNKNYHCFPVVENGKLVGIITVMDLLHHAYDSL